jgi:hypothetical protein
VTFPNTGPGVGAVREAPHRDLPVRSPSDSDPVFNDVTDLRALALYSSRSRCSWRSAPPACQNVDEVGDDREVDHESPRLQDARMVNEFVQLEGDQ